MKSYFTILTLLAATQLPAQGVVSPSHFTNVDGNTKFTSTNNPIGSYGTSRVPYRFLQLHEDLAGQPRTINSLAFRRDGGDNYYTYKAYTAYMDMWLSTALTTAAKPDPIFDKNHGPNKTRVLSFGKVDFPKSEIGPSPYPFTYKIVLPKPFGYDGKGPLCWEIWLQATQNANYISFDACYNSNSNPAANTSNLGKGCKATGYSYGMTNDTRVTSSWTTSTATFNFSGSNVPPSSLAFFTLGVNKKSFSGLPLPFPIPTSTSAPSGVCHLYADFFVTLPAFSSSGGYLTYKLLIPSLIPELHGVAIYSQILAADAKANPLGLITSSCKVIQLIAPYKATPMGTVDLAGSLGTTGKAYANYGYVVKFE